MMILGARRQRGLSAASWYLFAAGIALWVLGDVVYGIQSALVATVPFPSWADGCYLGSYPLLVAALFLHARQRGGLAGGTLIDSAIITVGVGIVYWALMIEPILLDDSIPVLARLVTAGYPTAGAVLCAVIVPMLLQQGARTVSQWLLIVGSLLTVVANGAYTLIPLTDGFAPFLFAGYLLAYAFWGAAAMHPSATLPPVRPHDNPGRGRLLVLTGSMLLVPAVMLLQGERAGGRSGWLTVAFGSMALFVLVASRLNGYIARVDKQAVLLRRQATSDDLTGLPNRREFERLAATAVTRQPCQVVMLDLAGFKHINDRLGRAAGDQALVAVAGLLRESVRDGDLVARMGADEFAVLVCDSRPGEAEAVAGRLADLVRRPVHAGEHELLLSARLGVSSGSGADATELVRRADTARYAAKTGGGHLVVYSAGLDEQAEAAERLGADLRHSLTDGDFHVVYQPIVELADARTVAYEALVRWVHPVRGFVSPADFIPIAEDNGLIVELGEWIMRTACRQLADWQRDRPDAPSYISVNVSARQLSEPGFAEVVTGILRECGLEPRALLVEVTETAIFGGGVAIEAVEALHRAGVSIALDDFGTGHSSLGLLRTVPVDVLKVDKSFVDEITGTGRAVIVDALIHVSNGLGLRAVAEGIETAEQAGYLRELGYRYGQGYFFGKPARAEDSAAQIVPAVGELLDQGRGHQAP
ncbi:bifunctional diguanylate cyclase/phosphodiesterase [Actinoplanes bogorensis]|uniref:Bifunctional diguanylate cyclase/phosphodiesterase n=2 Tax=Paractinoplanes bogorensis TaxID=1610840 RepID=A0ABS5YPR4_9ACTN|nr:bifunctional diguanylate cyclase/phosphodiesterase [Actinoplanes bogorensis]